MEWTSLVHFEDGILTAGDEFRGDAGSSGRKARRRGARERKSRRALGNDRLQVAIPRVCVEFRVGPLFMRLSHQAIVVLALLVTAGTGCHKSTPTPQEIVESSVTEQFVSKFVRPLSDPVADLAHRGADLPPELLANNKVTAIEVIRKGGESQVIFEDETRRPPSAGMTTGVENARKIGLFYPASLDQPEIEVRVNYFCDVGDFVAVHVVVPNPLLAPKPK